MSPYICPRFDGEPKIYTYLLHIQKSCCRRSDIERSDSTNLSWRISVKEHAAHIHAGGRDEKIGKTQASTSNELINGLSTAPQYTAIYTTYVSTRFSLFPFTIGERGKSPSTSYTYSCIIHKYIHKIYSLLILQRTKLMREILKLCGGVAGCRYTMKKLAAIVI